MNNDEIGKYSLLTNMIQYVEAYLGAMKFYHIQLEN